ncbi:phosphoglycerate dehydrogenase [Methylocystis parvus]|uniref:D-3-phosphoglycerate dehydrogenase n=1 Tax=Methylocystis parvus TaxID=134 RepID=A0A6B8LX71_9HYPH|nr:phosphoglycerate dehydrogenase [Methylocystis parvus]QGM97027.1 phosphoglycerate dehydrogenase [Methylocystis parvus]WBJ99078.1 phosphoglycerate dehydrogenase [Methylocystis parvus OBBP]
MPPRILISDSLSPAAIDIFRARGIEADFEPALGKDEARLAAAIGAYDGLAIRSATKVTAEILARAERLKVIGRAGIGVDNVDIPAATAKGVIVMNTPFGNSVTTAEHAIAMMFALARQIPAADASTQAGKWEKNRFMGVEIAGKTLGIVGCGNIGAIVADRALGLKMRVIAYDPFLTEERAQALGVEKVELDALLAHADVITLHTPMTPQTKNILSAEALARTRKGVRVVNCARGGLLDEMALARALDDGHVAGAALDVFAVEPATENPLFGRANVVCTPHLGASTSEAQEKVALQVAEQMSDYFTRGAVANAVNFPSITAEEAPRLAPFVALGEKLGLFIGQIARSGVQSLSIVFEGHIAQQKTRAITAAALSGLLKPILEDVSPVSAPAIAKERGIAVEEITREAQSGYESLLALAARTAEGEIRVAGTVFHDGRPRIMRIGEIGVDAEFAPSMIYTQNEDRPGFIGRFANVLGAASVNIATFALGRDAPGGCAVALVAVDGALLEGTLDEIRALPGVKQATTLKF